MLERMDNAEIARLKAEAAAAKAEAAQAAAEAAQAAYEAAIAGKGAKSPIAADEPAIAVETADPSRVISEGDVDAPEPAEAPAAPAELSGYAKEVAAGYSMDGSMQIGVLLEGEEPVPAVPITLPLAMLNRHGLIAGATGTGKTRTLQLLAEGLSNAGVSVFLTDIKGDVTGLAEPGESGEKLLARCAAQGQQWTPASFPTEFYALGGEGTGVPIRTTLTEFGPLLLARILDLNETQEAALSLIFHWADQEGLALIDLGDLRSIVSFLTGNGKHHLKEIGGIASSTAGVILREIAVLQSQGGDEFFGEPAFDPDHFFEVRDGRGVISLLELPRLSDRPRLFSTFVMWLLAELFEILPEAGDTDKPKLVFFFDEAHLLFNGASKAFLEAITQTVRLIRSKGVGIIFITQTPKDVPDDVLAQLGAKVQHALRAHTPNDQKALRETVKTFPSSPLDLEEILPGLGTGEALVTVLDAKGRPSPVAPTRLWAPAANMGAADQTTVDSIVAASPLTATYADRVDPESATELLAARIELEQAAALEAERRAAEAKESEARAREAEKKAAQLRKDAERAARQRETQSAKRKDGVIDAFFKSSARTLGREISRTIFGTRRR